MSGFGFVLGRDLVARPIRDAGQYEYAIQTSSSPSDVQQQQPPPAFLAQQTEEQKPQPIPTSIVIEDHPPPRETSGTGLVIGLLLIVAVGYGLAK